MIIRLAHLLLITGLFAAVWAFDGPDQPDRRFTATTAVMWRGESAGQGSGVLLARTRSDSAGGRRVGAALAADAVEADANWITPSSVAQRVTSLP